MIGARMAMHLGRVGGRFVAAMAVLFAAAGNSASAQEDKTYRCKVADVVRWGDDGRLRWSGPPPRLWQRTPNHAAGRWMTSAKLRDLLENRMSSDTGN